MTTGQRISAKRKELGLSQEALGEMLGVSRQSIYKWESDASLPDIDKLVNLSRLFHVSVGWLLGVEEDPPAAPEGETAPPPEERESSAEQQEKRLEEILSRYQAQQPKRSRWEQVAVGALCVALMVMLVYLASLNNKIYRLTTQYNGLRSSIDNVQSSVYSSISSVTQQVEEILKAQNDLTADYSAEITAANLRENTITFSLRAVPKTYVEGMQAVFVADSGGGPVEYPAELGSGHEFSGQLTCALTDTISLSVVFLDGDTRQTQLLCTKNDLYTNSFPEVNLVDYAGYVDVEQGEDGRFPINADVLEFMYFSNVTPLNPDMAVVGTAAVAKVQAGLFLDRKLVTWFEPCDDSYGVAAGDNLVDYWFQIPEMSVEIKEGQVLSNAALVTDEYGRQFMSQSGNSCTNVGGMLDWIDDEWDTDPAAWILD